MRAIERSCMFLRGWLILLALRPGASSSALSSLTSHRARGRGGRRGRANLSGDWHCDPTVGPRENDVPAALETGPLVPIWAEAMPCPTRAGHFEHQRSARELDHLQEPRKCRRGALETCPRRGRGPGHRSRLCPAAASPPG